MSSHVKLLSLALLTFAGCAAQRPNLIETGAVRVESPESTSRVKVATTYVAQGEGEVIVRGRVNLGTPGPHPRHSLPHVHVEVIDTNGAVARQWHAPLSIGPTTRRRLKSLAHYSFRRPLTLPDGAVVRAYLARDRHDES